MGNAMRSQPLATNFGENRTPVREDQLQVGILFAFGIIAFSFILIIPGIRGWERLWAVLRVFAALWIGAVLVVCNFGSWYVDSICTRTQYKAHIAPLNAPQTIQATVRLSISLRGFNVSLSEDVEDGCGFSDDYIPPFPGETIDYEESFNWAPLWQHGYFDFGEFGGQFRQEYRASQFRGLPYPILWVADRFLLDGDQYRWYRNFRIAGWYTHIWMWLAFALYLVTILLFIFNIQYGGLYMALTGAIMLLACLTYGVVVQNDPPLEVPFTDAVLRPNFNYAFYLTLVTGILTLAGGLFVVFMDWLYPRKIAAFFHMGIIEDDAIFEGVVEEEDEEGGLSRKSSRVSYGTTKLRRKGTLTHLRDSVRSTKSYGSRGDVLPREKSSTSLNPPTSPIGQLPEKRGSEVQLEMVTVHENIEAA